MGYADTLNEHIRHSFVKLFTDALLCFKGKVRVHFIFFLPDLRFARSLVTKKDRKETALERLEVLFTKPDVIPSYSRPDQIYPGLASNLIAVS